MRASLYVDDFAVFTATNHLPSAERTLQRTLNNITRWTDRYGFKFSLDKTVLMKFQPNNKQIREPDLYLHGNRLKVVAEINFLGLIFDKKLKLYTTY